jgi:hypothetical protein
MGKAALASPTIRRTQTCISIPTSAGKDEF